MGRDFTILILVLGLFSTLGFSQAPLGINYQGVARNTDGSPMTDRDISIRISILNGSESGSTEYEEIHDLRTNAFGLFTAVIGSNPTSGSLNDVNWSEGDKWLRVEMDAAGGSNFLLVGSQQLFSVPYAMYAAESGTGLQAGEGIDLSDKTVTNTAPDQEVKMIGAGTVTVTGTYPDFVITGQNNDQGLSSVVGVDSNADGAILTNLGEPVDLQDAATKNYVDNLDVSDSDADPVNEIQELGLIGNTLSLTKNDSTVDLSGYVLNQNNDAGTSRLVNVGDPMDLQDVVTKNYLDEKDANDYAFRVPINVTASGLDITFNLSDYDFDEGEMISGTQITIQQDGIYYIVIKGFSDTVPPIPSATLNLVVKPVVKSVVKYQVHGYTGNWFYESFFFKLELNDVIELEAIGTSGGEVFDLQIFGYKI